MGGAGGAPFVPNASRACGVRVRGELGWGTGACVCVCVRACARVRVRARVGGWVRVCAAMQPFARQVQLDSARLHGAARLRPHSLDNDTSGSEPTLNLRF